MYIYIYLHIPIHYIASTAGFGIHLSVYLSGYRIGFTKDEGVTGKDDSFKEKCNRFQLEVQNQFSSCCGWVLSTLEVWTCIRSDSKVSWRSVGFQVFPSFSSPLFILKVLTISPIALQFSSSSRRPSLSQGAASQASHFPGWGSSCTAGAGLASIIVSFFFFLGGGGADLKTNRDELLRNHQLIVGCSQIVYFRGFISPQPRLQGQVLSTWGEVIATATWTPDSRFESLVDEWCLGETHMGKRCKTPFLAHIKLINDYIFILWYFRYLFKIKCIWQLNQHVF